MKSNFFEVLRPGVNSTFQDLGRENFYHIGLPSSGAMDKRNFLLANCLAGNSKEAAIEFAYQGPLLKFKGESAIITITGDVNFNIIKKDNNFINGECYRNYKLENEDKLDIISTNKSVYGYLAVSGGFAIKKFLNSYSTFSRAKIGPFDGKKLFINQKLEISKIINNQVLKKIKYLNTKIEYIRIIKGTNYDYFSDQGIDNFLKREFIVTKLTDRMGMRIKGPIIENIKDKNIRSEGIVKGTIQIPPDGNPIIMLSDHGTIGGYPKIGVVISADLDRVAQLPPGTNIKFKEVTLVEAENLFKNYLSETNKYLNAIN